MPRSPQWMDLYQIWFEGSSRGRNQLCRISWISILWGVKIRHLPLTWPVAQPVISNFCDFDACKPTFWSHNHEVWRETWDTFPAPKFVKIAQGDSFLRANFYLKFKIFTILSYLHPAFYTHNAEILHKRTDSRQQKISSDSLKGPAGIALPRRLCILISSYYYYYYYYKITTEQDWPSFAIEEWNRDRTSSSRDVRSNPITSLAKRSWFFSRKPRASYSTYNQPLQQTELHCVPKTGSHLMFDNNFGKCGPIFKILLPIDS